jgi:microcystin-dependent protein
MASPFLGEVKIFAGNFAPRGWAMCNGQLMSISQNTALFSILGTTYGGNGQTTFALPDFRSRLPVHQGQGPGLTPYNLGEMNGVENVTLLSSQIPLHNHAVNASTGAGTAVAAGGGFWATDGASRGGKLYASTGGAAMGTGAIGQTGGGVPHNNIQPFLALNFIVALQGVFPARN